MGSQPHFSCEIVCSNAVLTEIHSKSNTGKKNLFWLVPLLTASDPEGVS